MFTELDLSKEIPKVKLFLCKPNKTIIGVLNEAYDIKPKLKLGKINEISFSLPYEIDINHKLVRNKNIDLIKYRYLIKLQLNNYEEYFLINKPIQNMDDDYDYFGIECFSLGIELADRELEDYQNFDEEHILTIKETLDEILADTLWSIGHINSEYINKYHSLEANNKTILDFLYDIAETLKTIIIFDTVNRKISFYKESEIGLNRGLFFNYGKYLKTLSHEINPDEFCTRLKVYGENGLTIQEVNPSGKPYLEDYSYYIYPYRTDENGNVIEHSYYMSDELCQSLLEYNKLLESKNGIMVISENGTTETNIKITNHGLINGDYILNKTRGNEFRKITVIDSDNISVNSIVGQTLEDIIYKYKDGTFRKLLFAKENLNNELFTLENELSEIENIRIQILDNIGTQQELGSYYSYNFIYNGSSVIKTAILNNYYKYAILCNVSNISNLTIKVNNNVKTLQNNTWQILDKLSNSGIANIDLSGTAYTSVKIVIVKITDEEYNSANSEDIINKYCIDLIETQRSVKMTEVNNKNNEISNINSQIYNLRNQIDLKNNLTENQYIELKQFIIQDTWEDDNYFDALDLFDAAIEKFIEKNSPQAMLNIDIVNFLECIEEQRNWDKLTIGDEVNLIYDKFNLNIKAKIIEAEYDFENYNVSIIISNVKKTMTEEDKVMDQLYKSMYTTKDLQNNKKYWNEVALNFNARNDRNSSIPANPAISGVNHTVNTDGSCNITFRWEFNGSGRSYDIDGFIIYVRSMPSSDQYIFGSNISSEQMYSVISGRRSFELPGVPINKYYTFGVQAYRKVDSDINNSGYLKSDIITINTSYLPSEDVVFKGDLGGTIGGIVVQDLIDTANNAKYSANVANSLLADLSNDDKLTSIEKQQAKKEWDIIVAEKPNIDIQADTFEIIPEKASYDSSYNALNTYITPLLENLSTTSDIIGVNFRSYFKNYYDQKTVLLKKIASVAKQIADNAQNTANEVSVNFNARNDRISEMPANPIVLSDGSAIDHIANDDGSVDISFEWQYDGIGNSYDIDGFIIYTHSSNQNNIYAFGSLPNEEQVSYISSDKRAFILRGVSATRYYTFGVQAYRNVDQDINNTGVLISSIIKTTATGENPYQPSTQISFSGNIIGTLKDKFGSTIVSQDGLALENIVGYGIESGGVISCTPVIRSDIISTPFISYDSTTSTMTVSDTTNFPASGSAGYTYYDYGGLNSYYTDIFTYTSKDATHFYGLSYINRYNIADIKPNSHIYLWPNATVNLTVSSSIATNIYGIKFEVPEKKWISYNITTNHNDIDGWEYRYIYIDNNGQYQIAASGTSGGWTVMPIDPPAGCIKVGFLIVGYGTEEPNGELESAKDYDENGLPVFKAIIKHDIRYRKERLLRTENGNLATNLVEYGTKFESFSISPNTYKTLYFPLGSGKKQCSLSITSNTDKTSPDNLTQGANFTIGRKPSVGSDYGVKIVWGIYVDSAGKAYHVDQKRNNGTFDYIIPPSSLNCNYIYIVDMDLLPDPNNPAIISLKVLLYNPSAYTETMNLRFNWTAS